MGTSSEAPTPRPAQAAPQRSEAAPPRQRILDVTLSLMAQRGVDGTSMRDLASAAGLNVASLYHYFPSKRDLLLAVLAERGVIDDLALPFSAATPSAADATRVEALTDLLDAILESMLEVEEFIRLMLGEVMRGQETVQSVGRELVSTTQAALERWLTESQPELTSAGRAPALARALRAFLIGLFFEHVSGVMDDEGATPEAFHARAQEMAAALLLDRSQDLSSSRRVRAAAGSEQPPGPSSRRVRAAAGSEQPPGPSSPRRA